MGADICTLPWDIFNKMYDHCLTDAGLQKFDNDWNQLGNDIDGESSGHHSGYSVSISALIFVISSSLS